MMNQTAQQVNAITVNEIRMSFIQFMPALVLCNPASLRPSGVRFSSVMWNSRKSSHKAHGWRSCLPNTMAQRLRKAVSGFDTFPKTEVPTRCGARSFPFDYDFGQQVDQSDHIRLRRGSPAPISIPGESA